MLTLKGGTDIVSGTDISACSWTSTSGFCPTVITASMVEGAKRQRCPCLESFAPLIESFSRCSESDGFSTANVSVLVSSTFLRL